MSLEKVAPSQSSDMHVAGSLLHTSGESGPIASLSLRLVGRAAVCVPTKCLAVKLNSRTSDAPAPQGWEEEISSLSRALSRNEPSTPIVRGKEMFGATSKWLARVHAQ